MAKQSTVLNKDNNQAEAQGKNMFLSKMPLLEKVSLAAGITSGVVGFAAVGCAAPILNKNSSFWINLGEVLDKVSITPDVLMAGGNALIILGGIMLINGVKHVKDIEIK